jgi:hypothetical protein
MTTSADLKPLFAVRALPAEELTPIRQRGVDDFGHPLRVSTNDSEHGTPLRCCLRDARVGESVALISWRPLQEAPASVYAEVGPIFIHAHDCPGYQDHNSYPDGFRHRQQVLRSYSAAGDMLDAVLIEGANAESGIAALLATPETVVLHSRNVKAGCYMFAVYRG